MNFFTEYFQGTTAEWRLVFWITACILLVSTAIFTLLGSSDLEPWAMGEDREESVDSKQPLGDVEKISVASSKEKF